MGSEEWCDQFNGVGEGTEEPGNDQVRSPPVVGVMTEVLGSRVDHLDTITEIHLVHDTTHKAAAALARVHEPPRRGRVFEGEDHARNAGSGPEIDTAPQNAACGRDVPGRMTTKIFDADLAQDAGITSRPPGSIQLLPVGIRHRLRPE